jgi:hypothetical protein
MEVGWWQPEAYQPVPRVSAWPHLLPGPQRGLVQRHPPPGPPSRTELEWWQPEAYQQVPRVSAWPHLPPGPQRVSAWVRPAPGPPSRTE